MLRRRRSGVNVRCHISGSSVSLSLSNLRWRIVPCIHVHTLITRYPLPTITGFSKNQRLVQSMIDTRKNSAQTVWGLDCRKWQSFMHSMAKSLKPSFWRSWRRHEKWLVITGYFYSPEFKWPKMAVRLAIPKLRQACWEEKWDTMTNRHKMIDLFTVLLFHW